MKISLQTIIWSIVVIAIVLASLFAFIPKPVEVELAKVTRGPLRVTVREDGKTRIREKYVISSPVAGRLSRVEFNPGDDVECNVSIIAVILPADPAMLDARSKAQAKARVEQAQATVQRSVAAQEQAQINFELSQSKLERAKKMYQGNAMSEGEFDVAQSNLLKSSSQLRAAQFDLEIAQFELKMAEAALLQFSDSNDNEMEPFEISSPISGKVLRVFQESATVVGVGTPLLEVGDPENLEIEIDVLSTDAVRIQPRAPLTIEHWGGERPLHGQVRVVEPAAFTKVSSLGVEEQRVNVIADFNEPPERLATLGDGYRVEARITVEHLEDVLLVPNSALFRHQREWHVFRVNEETAELQPVEIGMQNESNTEILEGLQANDEVVVYPGDQLQSGTRIKRAQ